MSRPAYNFADERPSSPFDRPAQAGSSVPPQNFKTNVNRNKTRKWAEAKQHNYDGDEWGGFDPYDEYGNYDDPAGPPQNTRPRQHSFDRGEERRAFSAGTGPPGQYQRGPPQQQRRDFSQPAYEPAPLKATQSPVASRAPAPVSNVEEDEDHGSGGKAPAAIPFIRPSDIYKRMEQERERERRSQDSSRPSIDSASSKKVGTDAPLPPIPSIDKKTEIPPTPQQSKPPSQTGAPAGPAVTNAPTNAAPSIPDDMPRTSIDGFQSIVDRAFDRPDDNSVPPTPISASNSQKTQDDLSRSNSESTTGISPIMNRVPSSTTDESRGRVAAMNRERAMSNISEEIPLEPPPRSANRQSATMGSTHSPQGSEGFIPGHTRKVSTPSPHASPARSPRLETPNTRRLSQPLAAEVKEDEIVEPPSATSNYSQATYPTSATSDKATPAIPMPPRSSDSKSPIAETPATLRGGSRSSTPLTSPVEGRKSPFPGAGGSRVRDLAGKYNDIHEESRRNSSASIKSKTSFSSLRQKSRSGSGHASPEPPVAASPVGTPAEKLERPTYNPQPSFRPHLPGEWISTTDLRNEPAANQSSNLASTKEEKDLPKTPTVPSGPSTPSDVDFTPRAAQVDRSASTKTASSGPADALKAAGAALVASLTTTVGTSHQARDFAAPKQETPSAADDQPKRSIGDVYMRPLEFQRTASSVASSGAPSPPAKDTPKIDEPETRSAYFADRPKRDSRDSWEGSDEEPESGESDRLRREIVRSLTPQAQERGTDDRTRDQTILTGPDSVREEQNSGKIQPTQSSPLRSAQAVSDLPEVAELDGSGPEVDAGPGLLNKRFSWESKPTSSINPSGLASEVKLPQSDLHVTNQEVPVVEKTRASEDSGLQRRLSTSSATPVPAGRSPVSPVANAEDGRPSTSENPPSPIGAGQVERSSTEANARSQPETIVNVPLADTTEKPSAKIASFREIANIKSAPERIEKYDVTRKQFADMNTGLQGWLSTTIAANPELNYLTNTNASIAPGGTPSGTSRHRQTPSIIKMAKGFGSKGDGPSSPSNTDGQSTSQPTRRTSNNFSGHSPQSSVNAEKMQAMGKDFLSSAGKLGGKGITGAKGWLAKGKQRLRDSSGGGDKAPSADISRSVTPTSSAAPTTANTRSSSPGLSDAPLTTSLRTRLSKRNSSSWSTNRLSMTFGLRSDRSEKSRSRSRPQSLILPSRSGTPMLDMDKLGLDEKIVEESPHPDRMASQPSTAAASAWTASWEQQEKITPAPLVRPFNEPGFRLGVLPSPGVETFSSPVSGSPVRNTRLGSDAGSRLRRDTVDGHILSPIAQRSPENDTFQTGQLPESLERAVSPLGPQDVSPISIAELGSPSPTRENTDNQRSADTVGHNTGLSSQGAEKNQVPVAETAPVELGDKSPVELPTSYEWEPHQPPQKAVDLQSKSPIEIPVTDLSPLEQPREPEAESSNAFDEKKDTPMISSPEFRLNDQKPTFGSEDERREWEGVRARISKSQLSATNDSKRSSGMALSSGLHSVPSDISLISAGTVEQPAQVELVRVGSPKLINNRSSLPSQSRKSSYARSPLPTPHREIEHLRLELRNTDSPTVPEHLTPRSTTFPPEMYDSDTTPFTTPGDEDRRIDETLMQTPTAPRAEDDGLPVPQAARREPPQTIDVARMPLVPPEQKRFGVVAQDVDDTEPSAISGAAQPTPVVERGREFYPQSAAAPTFFPPSRDLTPPAQSNEPYGYRRTPPRRLSGADGQRWSQYQTQLDRDTQFGSDYYAPPQYEGQVHQPVVDSSDMYHRDYMDDRLVEMSPLEATVFDRENAFRQATERQQQEGANSRKHSRTPSLGPSLVSEPPKSSHHSEPVPAAPFKRSSSRLLGAFDRPSSGTPSTLNTNRMSNMTSTMDLDAPDSPAKGKLLKKTRRVSSQKVASTPTPPPPQPEKKKRFSGFGSLFGRSKSGATESTSSASTSKRNRLSKQGPMIISAPRQISPEKLAPQDEYGAPNVREQATLADDNSHSRSLTPLSRRSSGMVHSSPSRSNTLNTLGSRTGWSGPSDQQEYPQPTLPNVQSSTRRLHSERSSKRFSYIDVPDEFQPVDSSYRAGMSPVDPPRLSQVFEQTIPPQRGQPGPVRSAGQDPRTLPSSRFPSNGSMGTTRQPSYGSGSYAAPDNYRRTSSNLSGYSSISPAPQRLNSLPQVMANQPPRGLRDNNGYYIPEQVRQQGYPAPGNYGHPSYDAPPGDDYYYPPQGAPYSGPSSGYHTPNAQDSVSMHSGSSSRRGSNALAPQQSHRRRSSREASVPYSFMTVNNQALSPVPPVSSQGPSPNISPERQSRRLSAHNPGYEIRHESPSKQQADEHNQFVRQEYERRQQGHRTTPSAGSRDSDLYARPIGRPTPPQPGRLVTDFSGNNAVPQQGGTGHKRNESEDAPQMKGASYPGQEWTPLGVEEGRYTWE